jgi:integrase
MKTFLASRSGCSIHEPLFLDKYGNVLRRSYLVSTIKLAMAMLGLDPTEFSGHSLRAGAATTGADRGFENWEIQLLGRWSSDAYRLYLRNPKLLATFANRLAIT